MLQKTLLIEWREYILPLAKDHTWSALIVWEGIPLQWPEVKIETGLVDFYTLTVKNARGTWRSDIFEESVPIDEIKGFAEDLIYKYLCELKGWMP